MCDALPDRIAAYITAYEDATALNTCLLALSQQTYPLECVYVLDNSQQPLAIDPQVTDRLSLEVVHHPENIGIAAGIWWAVQQAQAAGAAFLWMFDQDSQPAPECLTHLMVAYGQLSSQRTIGIVAPHAIDARTGQTIEPAKFLGDRFEGYKAPHQTQPFICDAPITSGSLLWLATLKQVPPPDPKLFMDGVDLDYGLRLRRAGFDNFIVPSAQMVHRFGAPKVVGLWRQKRVIQTYSALRHYYICRNHTYLEVRHSQPQQQWACRLRRIRFALRMGLRIILFEPGPKRKKLRACIIGTYNGLRGRLDQPWLA